MKLSHKHKKTIRVMLAALCAALLVCGQTAQAQEAQIQETQEGYVYSPENCEFEVTFPSEPYTTRRCHPNLPDECDLMTSFTKVFELSATLNFYVTCEKTEEDMYNRYTGDIMRTILIARAGDRLETSETGYAEDEKVKIASLLGAGPSPNSQDVLLYVAQLWVGHNSLMTVEGELIGGDHEEADRAFAEILRSLRHKDWDQSKVDVPAAETSAEQTGEAEQTSPSAEE